METKLSKKAIIVAILFFITLSIFAQQVKKEEYTIVPIDSIYLKYNGNKKAINNITSKNIQRFLGKPINIKIYKEKWSDEYDKETTYEYKLLTICFQFFEKEEWLYSIECSSAGTFSFIINGVKVYAGVKDSVLNVFKKSWETYQELNQTKDYQNRVKKGDIKKTLIVEFPIKKGNYKYFGSIFISIKDGIVENTRISLQDEP
jgi:hypothetical protein